MLNFECFQLSAIQVKCAVNISPDFHKTELSRRYEFGSWPPKVVLKAIRVDEILQVKCQKRRWEVQARTEASGLPHPGARIRSTLPGKENQMTLITQKPSERRLQRGGSAQLFTLMESSKMTSKLWILQERSICNLDKSKNLTGWAQDQNPRGRIGAFFFKVAFWYANRECFHKISRSLG